MTVNTGATNRDGPLEWATFTPEVVGTLTEAYLATYHGPQRDVTESPGVFFDSGRPPQDHPSEQVSSTKEELFPAALAAQFELGRRRPAGETRVVAYADDDSAGFGPALQVIADHAFTLADATTVLLHRLGVAYVAVMNPVFRVQRSPSGDLQDIRPAPDEGQGSSGPDSIDETWIYVHLAPSVDRIALGEALRLLPTVLADARHVALDSGAMATALRSVAEALDSDSEGRFRGADRSDVAALLRWLDDDHFVLMGYQHCPVRDGRSLVEGSSSLGLLRLREDAVPQLTDGGVLLVLAQATIPTYLRHGADPYIVVIREDTADAAIEHRFLGLFTFTALNANVLEIPLISSRVHEALALQEGDPSQPRQLLLDVIQTFPHSELFALNAERLLAMATAVIDLDSRRQALLFVRADQLGYFVSCLVYLPRDRYTTAVRLQMQDILVRELGGEDIEYTARVSESPWAVVHFTVRLLARSRVEKVDTSEDNRTRVQAMLTEATRTWADQLTGSVSTGSIDQAQAEHYGAAFPEAYKQAVTPSDAINDIAIIEELHDDSVKLVFSEAGGDGISHLTWYLGGRSASLSQLLPMLQCMGVIVLEERPFTATRADGLTVWIYQFKISQHPTIPQAPDGSDRDAGAQRFAEAVTAIWQGHAEIDRFNELVLRAEMTWQQVVVVRSYAKYLRQAGFSYSQSYIESVLNANPGTARSLVELFEALFDPSPSDATTVRDADAAAAAVAADIDAVVGLDTDRVLRAFATLVRATLRTNYFVTADNSARNSGVLSVKLDPGMIDELPLPRPKFEIFVYSPRVEGVHLRFGPVARGGLRWSERREDFRTEVLGLVKAQAVKNAVIVPVGAKGGFVVKEPPSATGDADVDRDATRNEGIACYRLFIAGLLDITDNIDRATGEVITPPEVARRDGDDAYLVVAADKGTAAFSDIANDVAKAYGFWLGDAFASGGSVGYDHKTMGITAKGSWESVKRHFREMGVDTQAEDFTVVGVGDMSGDVFGNGMLLSKHIRLIAAFDHRHVFLDPNADPAKGWAERRRLFELPRSSWEDYDKALISKGGGVFSREQKSISLSPQIRAALGIEDDVEEMSPPNLVNAVLRAPVDLLFNGGIGTYIKAEAQSNGDVGDKANDPVRVNANQVRAKVIGEGGNLGITSLGRVEFDLCGGRLNTDAVDNSAGVDCSDHEVNIKILIDSLVTAGKISGEDRTDLLVSMTEEVGKLVLGDIADQNDLMGTSRANAAGLLAVHARQIADLEAQHGLNRELEGLPPEKEISRRHEAGRGLTSPELATLMAHVKLALKDEVLASDLPDQEIFAARLPRYFPAQLRDHFSADIRSHQLRREIVTTMLVNDLIGCAGITYAYRITEDIGVGSVDAVRAFVAIDAVFDICSVWRRVRAMSQEGAVPTSVSDAMTHTWRRLIDRAGRWLLNYRPQPLAVDAEINRFAEKVNALRPRMSEWLRGADCDIVAKQTADFTSQGASEDLASMVATGLYQYSLLHIIDIADVCDRGAAEVADAYFALMDHLGTDTLLTAVSELPRDDRWHSLARLAIRDDIYGSLRSLVLDVLAVGEPDESGEEKIAGWQHTNGSRVERARRTLTEINESDEWDLATLSVAAQQVRNMIRTSRPPTSG